MISNFWDARTARVLSTILIFVVVLAFLHGARETLTLFLFAVLFAYFVDPLVGFLSRRLHGRTRAIIASYLLIGGVLTGLGFLLGPRIANEGRSLLQSLPAIADRLASGQFILSMSQSQGWTHAHALQIQGFFMSHRNVILGYGEDVVSRLEAPLTHAWWIILIPILSVFFLKDAQTIAGSLIGLGDGRSGRSVLRGIVGDVNVMLGSYIRAQMILAALTGVVLTLAIGLMHVPFAFVLGPLAGFFEFIPVVGPAIACALIFGIALVIGYNHLLALFLVLGTWRIIQDYVNAPRIMGRSLEISPLVEIFAVLAGGEIGGVVGALVSVPVLATLRILWQRLCTTVETKVAADAAERSAGRESQPA